MSTGAFTPYSNKKKHPSYLLSFAVNFNPRSPWYLNGANHFILSNFYDLFTLCRSWIQRSQIHCARLIFFCSIMSNGRLLLLNNLYAFASLSFKWKSFLITKISKWLLNSNFYVWSKNNHVILISLKFFICKIREWQKLTTSLFYLFDPEFLSEFHVPFFQTSIL